MTEYEILSLIHKRGNTVLYRDVVTESLLSNDPDILSDDLRIRYLIEEKYVSRESGSSSVLRLTQKGIIRLDELSKEIAEKRNQRIFEVVLAIISALAGALLSQPLWDWIS